MHRHRAASPQLRGTVGGCGRWLQCARATADDRSAAAAADRAGGVMPPLPAAARAEAARRAGRAADGGDGGDGGVSALLGAANATLRRAVLAVPLEAGEERILR